MLFENCDKTISMERIIETGKDNRKMELENIAKQ